MFRQIWGSKIKLDAWVSTREGLAYKGACGDFLSGLLFFMLGLMVRNGVRLANSGDIVEPTVGILLYVAAVVCVLIGFDDIVCARRFKKEDSEESTDDF